DGNRHLSLGTAQRHLPAALPLAARFPAVPLARGPARRLPQRPRSWRVLPGLLLGADGAFIRRRDHEPRLDRRDRAPRADREDIALGRLDGPAGGNPVGPLGGRYARDGRLTAISANIRVQFDASGRKPCRSPLLAVSISITRSSA